MRMFSARIALGVLMGFAAGALSGCDDAAEASTPGSQESPVESTLFGLQLESFDEVPRLEVAVRISPAVEDEDVVPGRTAQLLADALRGCKGEHSPDGFREPKTIELRAEDGKLSAPETNAPGWPRCLASHITGEAFETPGGPRQITIQLARAAID